MNDLETVEGPARRLIFRCGCEGLLAHEYAKPATIAIIVQVPCLTGHPTRVAAGVIERFTPNQIAQQ